MATRKVTLNLPEEDVRFLQEIAEKEHLTFTDTVRRAIKSEKFFVQQETSGRKVLVEEPDQRVREVVRK
jgi:hypothetical protein